jgi:uncharacterized paraquat-inducible protein A
VNLEWFSSWCPRSELGHVSRPRCGFACHSFRVPPAKRCFACGLDLNRRKKSSLKLTLFSHSWCPRSELGHVSRPRCGPQLSSGFACGLDLNRRKKSSLKRTLFSHSWCPRSELGHVSRPRCGFACHSFRVPPAKRCFACGLDLNRRKKSPLSRTLFSHSWCPRRDSNPHTLRHMDLNHARLPIPPRGLKEGEII